METAVNILFLHNFRSICIPAFYVLSIILSNNVGDKLNYYSKINTILRTRECKLTMGNCVKIKDYWKRSNLLCQRPSTPPTGRTSTVTNNSDVAHRAGFRIANSERGLPVVLPPYYSNLFGEYMWKGNTRGTGIKLEREEILIRNKFWNKFWSKFGDGEVNLEIHLEIQYRNTFGNVEVNLEIHCGNKFWNREINLEMRK